MTEAQYQQALAEAKRSCQTASRSTYELTKAHCVSSVPDLAALRDWLKMQPGESARISTFEKLRPIRRLLSGWISDAKAEICHAISDNLQCATC